MILQALISPAGAVILTVVTGIAVAALFFARKQRNHLIDDGKLIYREPGFWDCSETFTVEGVSLEDVFARLPSEELKEHIGSYELQKDRNRIVFVHNGYEESYIGTLSLISQDNGCSTFCLLINQYKTNHPSPNEISLNVLFTAVENVFLEIDPAIKIKTEFVDRKARHSMP